MVPPRSWDFPLLSQGCWDRNGMGGEKTSGKNTGAVKREDAVHSFNLLKDKLDQ